jgi:hypothetical protein
MMEYFLIFDLTRYLLQRNTFSDLIIFRMKEPHLWRLNKLILKLDKKMDGEDQIIF